MVSKYYTPDITEFYIGYETEFFNIMQDKVWKHEIADADLINIAFDTDEHGTDEWEESMKYTFRTKYLDEEDIESLGWEKIEGAVSGSPDYSIVVPNKYAREGDRKTISYILYHRDRIYNRKNYMQIWNTTDYTVCVFSGIINNKSEMKKLMKQLEIL